VALSRVTRSASTLAPLSSGQRRLWFLAQLEPGSSFYNVALGYRIVGRLECEALGRALAALVTRHESLRTNFVEVGGEPYQVVNDPPAEWRLVPIDLRAVRTVSRSDLADRLAVELARSSFDLATDQLIRTRLIRLGEQDHLLVVTTHHIVSDGWSIANVLSKELVHLYEVFGEGVPLALEPLSVQYADFAAWQRTTLADARREHLEYWMNQLRDLPPALELPIDHPRPAMQSFEGGTHDFVLAPHLVADLRELARRQRVTVFMVLLATFKVLLARYTGTCDIVVGAPSAGRSRREFERLIGLFVNTVVLRTDLGGDPSFLELLRRVRKTVLDALAHEDLPFDELVDSLGVTRDLSRTPLVQIMFQVEEWTPSAHTSAQRLETRGGATQFDLVGWEEGTSRFDLELFVSIRADGGLNGRVVYAARLFDVKTIERLADHYRLLLESVASQPTLALSQHAEAVRNIRSGDSQVKVRGFRVEVEDIEAALVQHPRVRECAVALRAVDHGEPLLVAYIVADQSPPPASDELRTFLEVRLPGYMIPSRFLEVPALPRTPSGKLKRGELVAPGGDEPADLATAFQPARTELERTIARAWCEVLGLDTVGINENFFDLGGHSLLAVQLIARLRDRDSIEVELRDLVQFPTIEQIVARSHGSEADAGQPRDLFP